MAERGEIRNRTFAGQLQDFRGLQFARGITPTNVDMFLDFGDYLFILAEAKFKGSQLRGGQELALRRLTLAGHNPPLRYVILFEVEHGGVGDIDFGSLIVKRYYYAGKWHPARRIMTLREAIDKMLLWCEKQRRLQCPRLS